MIYKIVLVVGIVMPLHVPDITDHLTMPTIQACEAAAHDWLAQTPTPRVPGSIGISATCMIELEGDDP